jgi:hypothetical protein
LSNVFNLKADGIQEVSGSILLISGKKNLETLIAT